MIKPEYNINLNIIMIYTQIVDVSGRFNKYNNFGSTQYFILFINLFFF